MDEIKDGASNVAGVDSPLGLSINRRLLLGSSLATLAVSAFSMDVALAAGGDLTIALPNNPTTLDPTTQANHGSCLQSQAPDCG